MPTHRPHRLTSLVNQWLTLCIAAALLAAALPTSAYAQSGSGWSPMKVTVCGSSHGLLNVNVAPAVTRSS